MSTHMPGFQSFFRFFALFSIGEISPKQHRGYNNLNPTVDTVHISIQVIYSHSY